MKNILIIFFTLILAGLIVNSNMGWQLLLSFIVSGVLLLLILIIHLFGEKSYAPFISVFIVFNFLFFIVAPIIQLNAIGSRNGVFPTNLPIDYEDLVLTNTLIMVFNTIFILAYLFFKKRKVTVVAKNVINTPPNRRPLLIVSLAVLSLIIAVMSHDFVNGEMAKASWMPIQVSTSQFLLWKKVLFMVPFAGIIICVAYYKKNRLTASNSLYLLGFLVFFLVLLLWFKNPLVEKRNALGPIYITLIYLFIPRVLNSNVKTTAFMFFSMVIIFPLSAFFTHTSSTIGEILRKPKLLIEEFEGEGVSEVFNTIHYDAFINIAATIDFIKDEGFAYGEQFLSAFLFFVPRNLWVDKPISTGELVGDHLIAKYDFTYSNLSNPMVSEGYINFGVFGVILLAIALAFVVVKLLIWLESTNYLKKMMAFYFAIHLLFFLRGDFTNGFSYYIGTLIGVMGITKIVDYLILQLYINHKKWKLNQLKKA